MSRWGALGIALAIAMASWLLMTGKTDLGYPRAGEVVRIAAQPEIDEESRQRLRELTSASLDPEVRWSAVELLIKLQDPEAFFILQDRLAKDPSPAVRRSAVSALERLRNSAAVAVLLESLKDPDPQVRERATTALGALADDDALAPLAELAKDPRIEVRQAALSAADRIRHRLIQGDKTLASLKTSPAP